MQVFDTILPLVFKLKSRFQILRNKLPDLLITNMMPYQKFNYRYFDSYDQFRDCISNATYFDEYIEKTILNPFFDFNLTNELELSIRQSFIDDKVWPFIDSYCEKEWASLKNHLLRLKANN